MVRFGIGFAIHQTIYNSPKYEFAWKAHLPGTILKMHDRMMHTLPQPHGMFHWLCGLIGVEEVRLYAEEGHIQMPSNGIDVIRGQLQVEKSGRVRLRAQTPPTPSGSGSQNNLPRKRSYNGLPTDTIEISDDEIETDDEDLGGARRKKYIRK